MKKSTLLFSALALSTMAWSQQFMSRNAAVSFFSSTPMEDISGATDQGSAVLDLSNNRLAFQIPIVSFHFEKALMEEHFNENYMETEKYPAATFSGTLQGLNPEGKTGETQAVTASGTLTIHGVAVEREVEGTATRTKNGWTLHAEFGVPTADHEIPIPSVVREKIAESIAVTLDANLEPR